MMRLRSVVRDVVLLGLAVAIGWWVRGANTPVMAERSGSSSSSGGTSAGDANLAFQLSGTGPNTSLAVYNPANKTLYIYDRIALGNSSLSCSFSYAIPNPGAAIHRENCPVGELNPGH